MTSVHKPFEGDMTIDAGIFAEEDERQAGLKRERERMLHLQESARQVMSTAEGRRLVEWILCLTGMDESVTASDPQAMLYASARRDLGLDLRAFLREACLHLYKTMEEEADERRRNEH